MESNGDFSRKTKSQRGQKEEHEEKRQHPSKLIELMLQMSDPPIGIRAKLLPDIPGKQERSLSPAFPDLETVVVINSRPSGFDITQHHMLAANLRRKCPKESLGVTCQSAEIAGRGMKCVLYWINGDINNHFASEKSRAGRGRSILRLPLISLNLAD